MSATIGSEERSSAGRRPTKPVIGSPNLPIEIWHQIYDFVPKDASLSLYSVNRPLFHISMSSRYGHIYYDFPSRPGHSERQARALSGAATSKYVKELSVWLKPLQEYLEPPGSEARGLANCQRTSSSCRAAFQEIFQAFSNPVDLSSHLSALHTLTLISSEEPSHYRLYHRFRDTFKCPIQNALQSISQTLRALNLVHIPMELFRDDIISRDLCFPLLEDLRLDFSTIYHTTDYEDILQDWIAPFINHHSRSLKKLDFASRDIQHQPRYLYKYERLFQHLTHFPRLIHFSVRFFLLLSDEASLDQLSRFIQAHSPSLALLNLNLCHSSLSRFSSTTVGSLPLELDLDSIVQAHTPQTLFAHHLFSYAVRSCRGLKELDCMLLDEDALQFDSTPFLLWFPTIPCAETLTTLLLPYNTLKHTDLVELVSAVDLSGLRRLRVRVLSLDLALFDTFSSKLIGLQHLTIWASKLSCRLPAGLQAEWVPVCKLLPYSPFLADLRTRSYAQWRSLLDLAIPMIDRGHQGRMGRSESYTGSSEPQHWISEGQMRVAFPHIRSFTGEIRPFEV